MNPFDALTQLVQKQAFSGPLDPAEIDFVFRFMDSEDPQLASIAMMLLVSENQPPLLDRILENYHTYPFFTQITLLPFLGATFHLNCYKFLFLLLKAHLNDEFTMPLIQCLSKTQFDIFPLFLIHLSDPDPEFIEKQKLLLFNIGFNKVRQYLKMMPEIVYEEIFREVYGNTLIEGILPKPRQTN